MRALILWQVADLLGQMVRGRLFWAVQGRGYAQDRAELHRIARNRLETPE